LQSRSFPFTVIGLFFFFWASFYRDLQAPPADGLKWPKMEPRCGTESKEQQQMLRCENSIASLSRRFHIIMESHITLGIGVLDLREPAGSRRRFATRMPCANVSPQHHCRILLQSNLFRNDSTPPSNPSSAAALRSHVKMVQASTLLVKHLYPYRTSTIRTYLFRPMTGNYQASTVIVSMHFRGRSYINHSDTPGNLSGT
jgi:hypothetical protein